MRDILILFYNTMWGQPLPFAEEPLPHGCTITFDRNRLMEADAVIFHIPDLFRIIGDDEICKRDGQIWVGWCLECEENYPILKNEEFRELFDLWMGYHSSDDISYPYYLDYSTRMESRMPDIPFSERNEICMLISSGINRSGRREVVSELMKLTSIDSYGKLFNNKSISHDAGRESAIEIMRHYKFVIAFENAIANDYVTEKFYNPLYAGAIPIYLGAPNVCEFAPSINCYIDVTDYPSIDSLYTDIRQIGIDESKWNSYRLLGAYEQNPVFRSKLQSLDHNPIFRLSQKIIDIIIHGAEKRLKLGDGCK